MAIANTRHAMSGLENKGKQEQQYFCNSKVRRRKFGQLNLEPVFRFTPGSQSSFAARLCISARMASLFEYNAPLAIGRKISSSFS